MTATVITKAARAALRAQAIGEFVDTTVELPDGTLLVDFQPSTVEKLREISLESETLSDTIIRICATQKGYN